MAKIRLRISVDSALPPARVAQFIRQALENAIERADDGSAFRPESVYVRVERPRRPA